MPSTCRSGLARRGLLVLGAVASFAARGAPAQAAGASDERCKPWFVISLDRPQSILADPAVYVAVVDAAGKVLVEVGRPDDPSTWQRLGPLEQGLDPLHIYVSCVPVTRAAAIVVILKTGTSTRYTSRTGGIYTARCAVPRSAILPLLRGEAWTFFLVEPVVRLRTMGQEMVLRSRDLTELQIEGNTQVLTDPCLVGIHLEHRDRAPTIGS